MTSGTSGTGGTTSTSTSTATGTGGEASGVGGAGGAGGGAACDAMYTCAEAVTEGGDPAKLCEGPHAVLFDALSDCTCKGACKDKCGDNSCANMAASTDCKTCIADTQAGCGKAFNDCSNDI